MYEIFCTLMARYTRYRKYSRRRRRVWSTRLQNFNGSQSVGANQQYIIYYNLCTNPAQSDTTVSNKYTVKNINAQIELELDYATGGQTSVENLQAFIMFIPQGFIPTGVPSAYADIPYQHPEWILAHRFYGSPVAGDTSPGFPPLRMFSRLARKLDTGDRIVLIILGNNSNNVSTTLDYRGLVKYNTKAN